MRLAAGAETSWAAASSAWVGVPSACTVTSVRKRA